MTKHSVALLLSATILNGHAIAGTMGPLQSDWDWVGTFSAGPVWEDGGKTQTFYLTPDIQKTYAASQSSNALFNGEIFVGLQKKWSPKLQGQFGLAVAATTNATLSGFIWDDADPQFDNYTYTYQVQHTHIAIKGKLLAGNNRYGLTPWISGSIGVGFNNAHSFQNTPLLFEAIANANFTSHTQTALAYTIGAGIQKALSAHWQIGVGYEFADWGSSHLGRSEDQTLNNGLTLDNLYTNGVLFNLTYLT